MEQGKITPIYGQWLKENIAYYQFITPEAKKLASDINGLDIGKMENNQKLIDLYAEFVKMFCNSMHSIAFGINEKDISTKYIKAYLVENEYGVMAPVAFMQAYKKQASYSVEGSAEPVIQRMEKTHSESVDFFNKNTVTFDKLDKFPYKKRPKVWSIVIGMLLLIACCFGIYKNYNQIRTDIDNHIIVYLWIVIALILLLSLWKVFHDLLNYYKWKQYKINKKWIDEQVKKKDNNSSDNSNLVTEYSDKIKEAIKSDAQEIPNQPVTMKMYEARANKRADAITKMVRRLDKLKRRMGLIWLMILAVVTIFLLYGINNWEYRSLDSLDLHKTDNGNNEVVSETATTEETKTFNGFNNFNPESSEASSELYGKKSGVTYSSDYTTDSDLKTCWQEGVEGDGLGEAITYYFDNTHPLVLINVWNGRLDSEEKYYSNNRINQVEVICFNGDEVVYDEVIELKDSYSQGPVTYNLADSNQPINCDSVKLVIQSVYEGSKYDDTCLTDVKFYEGIYQ